MLPWGESETTPGKVENLKGILNGWDSRSLSCESEQFWCLVFCILNYLKKYYEDIVEDSILAFLRENLRLGEGAIYPMLHSCHIMPICQLRTMLFGRYSEVGVRLEHLEASIVGLALGMTRGEPTEAGSYLTVLRRLHLSHPQSTASFLGVLLSRNKSFLCYVNGEGGMEKSGDKDIGHLGR